MFVLDWFNDNQGAVQGIAAIAAAGLTIALIVITWRAHRQTRAAITAADEANEVAREANEVARQANLAASRGFFGASLVVFRINGKFIVRNLGFGPAHSLLLDYWVDGLPLGTEPLRYAHLAGMRRPGEAADFYLGHHDWEPPISTPPEWEFATGDPSARGNHEGKVHLRYRDQFGDQETFSEPFALRPSPASA
jgi:hypothetical protein